MDTVEVIERWGPTSYERWEDGVLVKEGSRYPIIPFYVLEESYVIPRKK